MRSRIDTPQLALGLARRLRAVIAVLGDYILHFPLTDFAVSLLVVGALVEIGSRFLGRSQWQIAVDWFLFAGFAGAVAAVGSGLWLVAAQAHPHDDALSLHHYFAYSTLGAATVAVASRLLQRRAPRLAVLRTAALVLAALLVSGAGYVGGKMAHPKGTAHSHEAMGHETAGHAHDEDSTHESPPPTSGGSETSAPPGQGASASDSQPQHDGHSHDARGHEKTRGSAATEGAGSASSGQQSPPDSDGHSHSH